MKAINWTRRNRIFAGLGGLGVVLVAVVLVFTFVGMPGGGKLFATASGSPNYRVAVGQEFNIPARHGDQDVLHDPSYLSVIDSSIYARGVYTMRALKSTGSGSTRIYVFNMFFGDREYWVKVK